MKNLIEIKKKIASDWFESLQIKIINQFQLLENESSKENKKKTKIFIKKEWKKSNKKEGGGTSYILSDGELFDKVGINKSTVSGKFAKAFRSKILGAEKDGKYWASGISVVAHMKNPKMPALHFNTRFIVTSQEWFGGGMDATPSFKDAREELIIHQQLKKICSSNYKNYNRYKKWCDKYFYLPHRKESRGIGGIFFDYETKNWKKNFKFIQDLGLGFIDIAKQIISSKKKLKWNTKDKEQQLYKRGRYVEFNLLYDRGTKFGLNSGGNTDSILMSLPPQAKWKYMNKEPRTVEGLEKLKLELDQLKNIKRPQIVAAIAEARSHGDLKENAEYHAAKEQQAQMESRVIEINDVIARANVIDIKKIENNGNIIFGSTVAVKDLEDNKKKIYKIVGRDEADISKNLIYFKSPIGKALIGKSLEDMVVVETPSGEKTFEVLNIQYI